MRLTKPAPMPEIPLKDLPDRALQFSSRLFRWVHANKEAIPKRAEDHLVDAAIELYENTIDLPGMVNKRSYFNHLASARRAVRSIQNLLHLLGSAELALIESPSEIHMEGQAIQHAINSLYVRAKQTLESEPRE